MFDVSRTRHGVMSIHSIAKHAQDTVIYSYLAALHAILHEDMEQDMLSQDSCIWRTCPKTLAFTVSFLHDDSCHCRRCLYEPAL